MQIADDLRHLAEDRIAADGLLVEDHLAIELDDVDAALAGDELRIDVEAVLQFRGQTGRLRQEVSLHAVGDGELHARIVGRAVALTKPGSGIRKLQHFPQRGQCAHRADRVEFSIQPGVGEARSRNTVGKMQMHFCTVHHE